MARKPTRFWHPAKRLLIQAHEKTRAFVDKRDTSANFDDVRPRLQHYLHAMYGEGVTIEALAPAKKSNIAIRAWHKIALIRERATSESDAHFMRLPPSLPKARAGVSPLEQYRVVAVQHAERIRRGTAKHARAVTTDLERDLYQLAEAATIDAEIVANQPGLRTALEAARADSMAARPKPRFRTAIELCVEAMFRRAWTATDVKSNGGERPATNDGADLSDSQQHLPNIPSPFSHSPPHLSAVPQHRDAESNATWARRTAVELESKYGRRAALSYRRVPEITLWQTTIRSQLLDEQALALETETRATNRQTQSDAWNDPARSALPGGAQSHAPQDKPGDTPDKSDSGNASSEKNSEGNAEGGDDEDNSDQGRTPESDDKRSSKAKNKRDPQRATDQNNKTSVDKPSVGTRPADSDGGPGGDMGIGHSEHTVDGAMLVEGLTFRYPEWDFKTQNLHPTGTIVRVMPPALASAEWATSALLEHARETQRAKRQFERLRSHRLRLRRQVQGDELDLEACVEALVDRQMRLAPSDRLYSHVRPGRRDIAITLLIDVSGSTGDVVEGAQRVIDLERIAALVATSAFDALGDDYSILAFSSASASNVRLHTLKEFGEKNGSIVMQRISALTPHGTTRLGAAVRHATATLSHHPAPHRLLLILSDGKPHDYDWYFVDYAVQDSRHAVMNARLQGIHPFCITVDTSDGETYLPEIFGSAGYRVVSRPSQLSQALLQAVQRMIGSSN